MLLSCLKNITASKSTAAQRHVRDGFSCEERGVNRQRSILRIESGRQATRVVPLCQRDAPTRTEQSGKSPSSFPTATRAQALWLRQPTHYPLSHGGSFNAGILPYGWALVNCLPHPGSIAAGGTWKATGTRTRLCLRWTLPSAAAGQSERRSNWSGQAAKDRLYLCLGLATLRTPGSCVDLGRTAGQSCEILSWH
jgi:hypothetical protein